MSYKINKTDGSLLVEIIDSEIDRSSTDLTLIGKNVSSYGEYINENFVKLLENFSSTSEPSNPITGQIWFDLSENRLKVYDGNGFRIGTGPVLAGTAPLTPNQGDFWIDTKEKQLYFYDSALNRYAASKIWKESQGKSGFEVETIADTSGNPKTITKLYNAGGANLLAIFSHHPEFEPSPAQVGFTTIKPGINTSSAINGFKLYGTATKADGLVDALGNLKTAEDFLTTTVDSTIIGNTNDANFPALTIAKLVPLLLGTGGETELEVGPYTAGSPTGNNNRTIIRSNYIDQDFKIVTRPNGTFADALVINGQTNSIGIFNSNPTAALDVTGNVKISGDLTVNGATTTINSTTLSVDDINIVLGATNSPTDTTANTGGITLKGTTDKTFAWDLTSQSWKSSENLNLQSGKSFKINNVDVLTSTALGANITSAPGLTTLGTLTSLNIGNTVITSGTISTTAGPLVINTAGTSDIYVSNSKITGLADPDPNIDTDAVNVKYVNATLPKFWSIVSDVDSPYQAVTNDRLFIRTIDGSVIVTLPANPSVGDTIRFLDYDSTFDTNPLIIVRARTYNESNPAALAGNSIGSTLGTWTNVPTIANTGTGSGLILEITTTANATYTSSNTTITVVQPGLGYETGDTVKVLGTDLGGTSPGNDMVITLTLAPILNDDADLIVSSSDAAFGLMYASDAGWKYVDTFQLPPTIAATAFIGNLTGNVTGNVTGDVNGNVTGDVLGDVTGDVNGNVYGDLTGTILTALQPNITTLGTLTGLSVSSAINADVIGNLTGNVNGDSLTATSDLTLESLADNVKIISGSNGLRFSAYDNTGTQEQYVLSVTPGTASGNRSTTLLFGDVVVANQTASNVNGSSFRLPSYTTSELAARTMSFLNYGEIVYNTDAGKMQAYVSPGTWVDLH